MRPFCQERAKGVRARVGSTQGGGQPLVDAAGIEAAKGGSALTWDQRTPVFPLKMRRPFVRASCCRARWMREKRARMSELVDGRVALLHDPSAEDRVDAEVAAKRGQIDAGASVAKCRRPAEDFQLRQL